MGSGEGSTTRFSSTEFLVQYNSYLSIVANAQRGSKTHKIPWRHPFTYPPIHLLTGLVSAPGVKREPGSGNQPGDDVGALAIRSFG